MSIIHISANVAEETICQFCEDNILNVPRGHRCTQHFCCEGSRCDDAIDQYIHEHPETEVWTHYEWRYEPSEAVKKCEGLLDDMAILADYKIKSIQVNGAEHFLTQRIQKEYDVVKTEFKKSLKNFAFTI